MVDSVDIPQTKSELLELLAMMLLYAPTFEHNSGYLPERNVDSVFAELDAGLDLLRAELGQDRHERLSEMSAQVRRLFESDPRDENGGTAQGQKLILEMEEIVRRPAPT